MLPCSENQTALCFGFLNGQTTQTLLAHLVSSTSSGSRPLLEKAQFPGTHETLIGLRGWGRVLTNTPTIPESIHPKELSPSLTPILREQKCPPTSSLQIPLPASMEPCISQLESLRVTAQQNRKSLQVQPTPSGSCGDVRDQRGTSLPKATW